MYFVKYGDRYLHDPRVGLILPTGNGDSELNVSDLFTFTITKKHKLYDEIKPHDRFNLVSVILNNKIIFRGEITNIEIDFNLTKTATCRGEMSYLNDSIVRPYSTLKSDGIRTVSSTIDGYFEFLINEHNKQMDESKQFKIGKNNGKYLDSNNYIYRSDTTYPKVGETIKNKILDNLGGYLVLDYEQNGGRTISLLDNFNEATDVNIQTIDFGVNLLDFIKSEESSEIATYVIPIGPDINEPSDTQSDKLKTSLNIDSSVVNPLYTYQVYKKDKYIEADVSYKEALDKQDEIKNDPDSSQDSKDQAQDRVDRAKESLEQAIYEYINANAAWKSAQRYTPDRTLEPGYIKKGDMIYSEKAVDRYGWIGMTIKYDEVTLVENLISKGLADLKYMEKPDITIEIKAIDLSTIKPDLKPIEKGQYIRVRSTPHNFDSYMLCSKISYDINKPNNNTFTLGTVYQTFTAQSNSRINKLNQTINNTIEFATKASGEEYLEGTVVEKIIPAEE